MLIPTQGGAQRRKLGRRGAGTLAPESFLGEAQNRSQSTQARGKISIFPAHIHIPHHSDSPRSTPRVRTNASESFTKGIRLNITRTLLPPFLSCAQSRPLKVCDWNFTGTPVSSMSNIEAGPLRGGALFLF